MLLNWSFVQGLLEDIGVDREEDNGRSSQLEVLFLEKKQYDFYPLIGPVESKLYIGITISVYELNKSRGFWDALGGGGGFKSEKGTKTSNYCVNLFV